MDRVIVADKLESLRRCVERVRSRCPPTEAALAADPDAQDIVSLNLTRAVQLAVDIAAHLLSVREGPPPATMGEAFAQLVGQDFLTEDLGARLRAAVGFRNIAVHSYRSIDWSVVFLIAHDRLGDFEDFARAVSRQLE